jgi:hypothetical protein
MSSGGWAQGHKAGAQFSVIVLGCSAGSQGKGTVEAHVNLEFASDTKRRQTVCSALPGPW